MDLETLEGVELSRMPARVAETVVEMHTAMTTFVNSHKRIKALEIYRRRLRSFARLDKHNLEAFVKALRKAARHARTVEEQAIFDKMLAHPSENFDRRKAPGRTKGGTLERRRGNREDT